METGSGPREHHLLVPRTHRYYTLGNATESIRECWIVCHGYGQLARRFLEDFLLLAGADRLLVAPEGPLRFYTESARIPAAQRRVGASWMTREDRLHDIEDYVRWLDAIWVDLQPRLAGEPPAIPRTVLLGFSQGAATAARWLAAGSGRVDELILWGSVLPPELLPSGGVEWLRDARVWLVTGSEDEYLRPELLADHARQLRARGVSVELVRYQGGHALDAEALIRIANGIGAPGR